MPSTTINQDGSITVTLDPQEVAMAVMVREESGPDVFDEVFRLQFTNQVRSVMNTRFARLPPQDQADLMGRMVQARPEPTAIPVARL
jgi:hypothetical protein